MPVTGTALTARWSTITGGIAIMTATFIMTAITGSWRFPACQDYNSKAGVACWPQQAGSPKSHSKLVFSNLVWI